MLVARLWATLAWTADGHVPLLITGTVGVITAVGMSVFVRSSAARVRSGSRRAAVAACEAGTMRPAPAGYGLAPTVSAGPAGRAGAQEAAKQWRRR